MRWGMSIFIVFLVLTVTGCASARTHSLEGDENDTSSRDVFYRMVLNGKIQEAIRFAEKHPNQAGMIDNLYCDWSDSENPPSPENQARFYELCCKYFPLDNELSTLTYATCYYKWQVNKCKVEEPKSLANPLVEIQSKLNEIEEKLLDAETEEEWTKREKAEKELQEELKRLEKDFLQKANPLLLYGFIIGEQVPLHYEGFHDDAFSALLERFPDSMLTVCALIQVGALYWEEDIEKLWEAYDQVSKRHESPMVKFLFAFDKYQYAQADEEQWEDSERLFENALELAPSGRIRALLLYENMVECDSDWAAHLTPEEASKPAKQLIKAYPQSAYAIRALNFMVSSYCWNNDLKGAERIIEEYRKEYPGTDLVSMSLFTLAREYHWRNGTNRSLEILKNIVCEHPDSSAAAYACLGLGEIYRELDETDKAIDYFSRAASFKEAPETQDLTNDIMDASNTRDMATEALAILLEETGQYEEALKWYRAWEPTGWCGNYLAMQGLKGLAAIARLLLATGRREEAIAYLKDRLYDGFSTPNFSGELYPAVQYVNLVVEDGVKLEDLEDEFKKLVEKDKFNEAAQAAYDYVKLLQKVEKEGLETVFNPLKSLGDSRYTLHWRTLATLDILRKNLAKSVDILIERLLEGDWHIAYFLGELGEEKAIKPLVNALFQENDRWHASDYAKALVRFGEDSVPGLIRCLNAQEKYVRLEAAEALGKLGDKRAFEPLLAELGKGEMRVGIVADALAGIGDNRAVAPLMEIFLRRNKDSFQVLDAVRRLTRQRFALDKELPKERQQKSFDLWEAWWRENKLEYEK